MFSSIFNRRALIMVKRILVGYGIDVDAVSGWYLTL